MNKAGFILRVSNILILLLFIVIIISCATVEKFKRHPDIEQTPIIHTIKTNSLQFVIRGHYIPEYAKKKIVSIANSIVKDITRRFKLKSRNQKIIDLYLSKNSKEYVNILKKTGLGSYQDTMGMYIPKMQLVLADIGISIGNLMHELVHPLLTNDFPEIPLWMNEGIATLYGKAIIKKKRVYYLSNFRIYHVRKAINQNSLPTLKQLAYCKPFIISIKNPEIYYSLSRCLMLYLDRINKLSKFYIDMRKAGFDKLKYEHVLKKHINYSDFKKWIFSNKH